MFLEHKMNQVGIASKSLVLLQKRTFHHSKGRRRKEKKKAEAWVNKEVGSEGNVTLHYWTF